MTIQGLGIQFPVQVTIPSVDAEIDYLSPGQTTSKVALLKQQQSSGNLVCDFSIDYDQLSEQETLAKSIPITYHTKNPLPTKIKGSIDFNSMWPHLPDLLMNQCDDSLTKAHTYFQSMLLSLKTLYKDAFNATNQIRHILSIEANLRNRTTPLLQIKSPTATSSCSKEELFNSVNQALQKENKVLKGIPINDQAIEIFVNYLQGEEIVISTRNIATEVYLISEHMQIKQLTDLLFPFYQMLTLYMPLKENSRLDQIPYSGRSLGLPPENLIYQLLKQVQAISRFQILSRDFHQTKDYFEKNPEKEPYIGPFFKYPFSGVGVQIPIQITLPNVNYEIDHFKPITLDRDPFEGTTRTDLSPQKVTLLKQQLSPQGLVCDLLINYDQLSVDEVLNKKILMGYSIKDSQHKEIEWSLDFSSVLPNLMNLLMDQSDRSLTKVNDYFKSILPALKALYKDLFDATNRARHVIALETSNQCLKKLPYEITNPKLVTPNPKESSLDLVNHRLQKENKTLEGIPISDQSIQMFVDYLHGNKIVIPNLKVAAEIYLISSLTKETELFDSLLPFYQAFILSIPLHEKSELGQAPLPSLSLESPENDPESNTNQILEQVEGIMKLQATQNKLCEIGVRFSTHFHGDPILGSLPTNNFGIPQRHGSAVFKS